MQRGAPLVVLVRGSEEPRSPVERRAHAGDGPASREIWSHQVGQNYEHQPRPGEASRTVVACVSATNSNGSAIAGIASALAEHFGSIVRQDDRICMIGHGRLVVTFTDVDTTLEAQILGARLAGSAAARLGKTHGEAARIVVGVADGEPGADEVRLTRAAINSLDPTDGGCADGCLVVVTRPSRSTSNNKPRKIETVRGSVLVIDTAPPSPGLPGPACAAVTSLVEGIGLSVVATIAPSLTAELDASQIAGSAPADAIALLVLHPGTENDADDSRTSALERPSALAQAVRQVGMRVVAVGVGASDIALAECLVQGAETAFAIAELPEGLIEALRYRVSDDTETVASGDPGSRPERLNKLSSLTRSERRVLFHLTTGATAIEIADKLVLSLATVRSHIRSILRKLEVGSQLAAVAIAQGHAVRTSDPEDRG